MTTAQRMEALEKRVAALEQRLATPHNRKEIPYKEWVLDEAARTGVTASAIYNRVIRGQYPGLHVRHVNQRVVRVLVNGEK